MVGGTHAVDMAHSPCVYSIFLQPRMLFGYSTEVSPYLLTSAFYAFSKLTTVFLGVLTCCYAVYWTGRASGCLKHTPLIPNVSFWGI